MESGSSVDSASLDKLHPPPTTPKTRIEQMRLIREQIQNDYPMDYRVHRHNEQLTELMMRVKEWREGTFTYDVCKIHSNRSPEQDAPIKETGEKLSKYQAEPGQVM